jgi:hypothetical protein
LSDALVAINFGLRPPGARKLSPKTGTFHNQPDRSIRISPPSKKSCLNALAALSAQKLQFEFDFQQFKTCLLFICTSSLTLKLPSSVGLGPVERVERITSAKHSCMGKCGLLRASSVYPQWTYDPFALNEFGKNHEPRLAAKSSILEHAPA